MVACVLSAPAPVETSPLHCTDIAGPVPARGQVLLRIRACGVCRTDLHVVEGDLRPRKTPVVPGHQAVGEVVALGEGTRRFPVGSRAGAAWLRKTCGTCGYCRRGAENLCEAAEFNGYTADGGYAALMAVPEDFLYALPDSLSDVQAAPLLCAGIIGYRCLRLANLAPGARLGIYGFGAAGHVAIQVARHWGSAVYVCTRDERHQTLAGELGADWVGPADGEPPVKLDSAIIFAPAGALVPLALHSLDKGGTLVLGGIHMSDIPAMPYQLLYHERVVRSVANNTRQDGEEFLRLAAEIPVRTSVEVYSLRDANRALQSLKHDAVRGAAVLTVG